MPPLDRIAITKDGTTYYLGGVEVTQREYERVHKPPKRGGAANNPAAAAGQWKRPTLSDSMGVHPEQVSEAEARNKRHGVNVTYDRETGQAIIPSRGEQRKLMKVMKMRDNNAFY